MFRSPPTSPPPSYAECMAKKMAGQKKRGRYEHNKINKPVRWPPRKHGVKRREHSSKLVSEPPYKVTKQVRTPSPVQAAITSSVVVQGYTPQNATPPGNKKLYEYEDLEAGDIRLLIVHPGSEGSDLECSLIVRRHNEAYKALSYVWGTEPATEHIRIRSEVDQPLQLLPVTWNLSSALRHLRHKDNPLFFWVDAICINQGNDIERNYQVQMMATIYHDAEHVCVWLGELPEDTTQSSTAEIKESADGTSKDVTAKLALSLIETLRLLKDFNRVVEKATTCEEWVALLRLMKCEWFSRRWVIQEIALARAATLYCGRVEIPWHFFADAVALFQEVETRVRKKFRQSNDYENPTDYIGEVSSLSASHLVKAVPRFVRLSRHTDGSLTLDKTSTLESLVSNMTAFKASRPHDTVYAVLSLATDVKGFPVKRPLLTRANSFPQRNMTSDEKKKAAKYSKNFHIDRFPVKYERDYLEAYIEFLKFVSRKSRSIDIICRPWAPETLDRPLPSFVRTLRESPHGMRFGGFSERINADALVGMPGPEKPYRAAMDYPPDFSFHYEEPRSADILATASLTVRGFILDTVADCLDPAAAGVIPDDWNAFGGWNDIKTPPIDNFWRTLVGDRDDQGHDPLVYYQLACQQTFQEKVPNGALSTQDLMIRVNSHVMERYIRRIQSVVWGRKLTRTKKYQLLGLTPSKPDTTEKGDLVCILLGCSVPVVLRRTGTSPGTGIAVYKLVGACYVHGMMMGAAFEKKNNAIDTEAQEFHKYQEFEIR